MDVCPTGFRLTGQWCEGPCSAGLSPRRPLSAGTLGPLLASLQPAQPSNVSLFPGHALPQ